ncbi:MAG: GTPase [Lachnospiraceae bacterium]|nr:GTPase [Lachnospiraceae bacterium]
MKPVYVINGFLESGKTEFIRYTLSQPYFQIKGKTLLIVCEEGEQEYEKELLSKSRTIMEVIDEEEDFNTSHLLELEKKYKPERIIIEYNGMWNFKNMKLPWHWNVEQQITTIDASTFPMYFTNMKSLLAEMIRKSEMIIFNRCDDVEDLSSYKRNVKAINQQADIIFEGAEGEINQIFEEDLPYNLNDPIIELDNEGYGIWYLDSLDNLDRYIGKTIQFTAMVLKPADFPSGYFIPGRMAMTCCAEDMAFLGFACEYDKASSLTEKQWVKVTAKVAKEYFADYEGEGPVLKAAFVEQTKAPKEPIISFM